jgi:hypothetical protein
LNNNNYNERLKSIMNYKNIRTARTSIEEFANYFDLTPKTMRVKNFGKATKTAWTKNKCSIYFHEVNGQTLFSYDGNAKAAYQLGLNILHDKQAQKELNISL